MQFFLRNYDIFGGNFLENDIFECDFFLEIITFLKVII
jgi:hypothetical protein